MRGFSLSVYVLVVLLLAGVGVSAQNPGGNPEARKVKNPVPSTEASITAGAATFKKYCSFCHNPDAKGEGALAPKDSHPPDLTDAKWLYGSSDGEIFAIIQNGAPTPMSVMKGFKGKIADADIWSVINFLRSIGPKTR